MLSTQPVGRSTLPTYLGMNLFPHLGSSQSFNVPVHYIFYLDRDIWEAIDTAPLPNPGILVSQYWRVFMI